LNNWQAEEIKAGLKEADAGDFATPTDVRNTLSK
jgi:predicted transcriptional regulator